MFDELITTVVFLHLIWAGHMLLDKSPPTALVLYVYVSASLPLPDRNVATRGGPGPGPGLGPLANFNRSTEDLRIKQQSANYGRLRECLFIVSLWFQLACVCFQV